MIFALRSPILRRHQPRRDQVRYIGTYFGVPAYAAGRDADELIETTRDLERRLAEEAHCRALVEAYDRAFPASGEPGPADDEKLNHFLASTDAPVLIPPVNS